MGKAGVVVGVVAAAAVGLVACSYTVGGRVEEGFRASLAGVGGAGLQVRVIDYRRGLFGAEARTMWTLTDGEDTIDLSVDHRIAHGPLPAGEAAQVHSKLLLSDALAGPLAPLLQGRSPLEVDTRVGWGGEQHHTVHSPELKGEIDSVALAWGGLRGDVTVAAGGAAARGRLEAPALAVSDDEGNDLQVERMSLEFDSLRPGDYRFWVGPATAALGRAVLRSGDGPVAFELSDARFASDAKLAGEVVDLSLELGVAKFAGGGESVDDLAVSFAIERVDAGALDTLTRLAEELGGTAGDVEAQQQRLFAGLQAQLPALLARAPSIEFRRVAARLPEGAAEFGARLAYTGQGSAEGFDPLRDLEGELRVVLPKTLLARLLESSEREAVAEYARAMDAGVDEARLQAAVRSAVDARIDGLTGRGLLVQGESALSLALQYHDGAISINGKPAEPGELGELGLPF